MFAAQPVVLVICCFCVGCVYSARYPSNWPQPEIISGECPNISGTYVDFGESALLDQKQMRSAPASLSNYFFGSKEGRRVPIAFSHPSERSIAVTKLERGNINKTRELDLDKDYSCRDSKIWFNRGNWIGEGSVEDLVFYVGWESAKLGFSRTVDGSLLGEFHTRGAVLAIFVPVVGGEDDYILWRVIDQSTVNLNSGQDIVITTDAGYEIELIKRDGLIYEVGATDPYTGHITMSDVHGAKESERTYIGGKLNGIETIWYRSGEKSYQAYYKDNLRHGPMTLWERNGWVSSLVCYENGVLVDLSTDECQP
jgi:hypothetical protein